MQLILRNLKDITGVIGSFVLNNDGVLVDQQMPSFVGPELYPDLGRRLGTVFGTLDTAAFEFDDLLCKFDEQWLYCRRLKHGFIGIVSVAEINLPALRMATNIAGTKVDSAMSEGFTPEVQTRPTTPEPIEKLPVTAAAVAGTRRFWRGQAVD